VKAKDQMYKKALRQVEASICYLSLIQQSLMPLSAKKLWRLHSRGTKAVLWSARFYDMHFILGLKMDKILTDVLFSVLRVVNDVLAACLSCFAHVFGLKPTQ
jgi:hypothetical protein